MRTCKVYFFGDSICVGQYVSVHRTWVVRIAARLAEAGKLHGFDAVVQNPSVNGDTTRQALERIEYHVQSHSPDIVLVQFGMNDCNHWETDRGNPRVSPLSFRGNLIEIIDRVSSCGAKQVIVNTNHPTTRTAPFGFAGTSYQTWNHAYNEVIRDVATAKAVRLVDIEQEWSSQESSGRIFLPSLLLPDGVHLSEQGHDMYFSQVYPVVEEAIHLVLGPRDNSRG